MQRNSDIHSCTILNSQHEVLTAFYSTQTKTQSNIYYIQMCVCLSGRTKAKWWLGSKVPHCIAWTKKWLLWLLLWLLVGTTMVKNSKVTINSMGLIHQYLLKNLLRFFLKLFLRGSLRKPYVRFTNSFVSLRIVHSCVLTLMKAAGAIYAIVLRALRRKHNHANISALKCA